MLEEAVPIEYIGAPDVGWFQDAEPVRCAALLEMFHQNGLDLVALIEEGSGIGIGEQWGTSRSSPSRTIAALQVQCTRRLCYKSRRARRGRRVRC